VRSLRPVQWLKNGFVLAPIVFSGRIGEAGAWLESLLAMAAFCAASSATYLVNDLLDREADRQHPTKRNRPIASGELGVGAAIAAAWAWSGWRRSRPSPSAAGFRPCSEATWR